MKQEIESEQSAIPASKVEVSSSTASKPQRRIFTRKYKLEIIERAEACSGPGEIGKLLRQEGLYSSHLSTWRRLRREGSLSALGRKRGPQKSKSDVQLEHEKIARENVRLQEKLAHAEKIIDIQKKLSEILGISLEGTHVGDSV